ncbi:hypothetical protein H0X32_00280 [Patescibacteria group bacterium]|nr:hypothetical protein [Patescibacteria group bacterium]
MIHTHFKTSALSLVALVAFFGLSANAHAQNIDISTHTSSNILNAVHIEANTGNGIHANMNVNAVTVSSTTRPADIKLRSDAAINQRLTSLQSVSARFATLQHLSATQIAGFQANVTTNINGLTALKTKIDGETDASILATDYKSIFGSFRVYLVVIPKGYELAAADRVVTIDGMMNNLSTALQTRITAAGNAGHNVVALQAALSDMNAKVTSAGIHSAAVTAGVSGLVPDQGNATVIASNKAALEKGRADTAAAETDLKAARADAQTIVNGLKSFGITASSTASVKAR